MERRLIVLQRSPKVVGGILVSLVGFSEYLDPEVTRAKILSTVDPALEPECRWMGEGLLQVKLRSLALDVATVADSMVRNGLAVLLGGAKSGDPPPDVELRPNLVLHIAS